MINAATIKDKFKSHHIILCDDWLEQCINWIKSEYPNETETKAISLIYLEWLNLDFRDVQIPILPPNISDVVETTLNQTIYLQLLYVLDISKPKYLQLRNIRSKFDDHTEDVQSSGLLKLQLTDGVQEVSAIEYVKIPCLNLGLEPGLKICFKPPIKIRRGQIMLEPQMIEFVGGCVPEIQITNCVENVLAAVLNQPLNNFPKIGNINNLPMEPVPDSQRTSVTLTNITSLTNVNTTRGNTAVASESVNNKMENNDFPNEFEDIITDEFFENHLDDLEQNRINYNTAPTETKDEIIEISDQGYGHLNNFDQYNDVNAMSNNSLTLDYKPVVSQTNEITPMEMESPQIRRPIMKIDKLNTMIHKVTKGLFNIQMEISGILEKIRVVDNRYFIKVLAMDESGEIEVQMSHQVMRDLVGIDADVFCELINSHNVERQSEISAVLRNLAEKCNDFHAHVVLSVEANKTPIVTEVVEMLAEV